MAKKLAQHNPPLVPGVRVDVLDNEFDALIDSKGVDVIWESAIKCPCMPEGAAAAKTSCMNCGGTGWVFINAVSTKMLVTSMASKNKRGEWSSEDVGLVNITPRQNVITAYMDRITVVNSDSLYSQLIYPKRYNGKLFSFLQYIPRYVQDIAVFVSETKALKWLSPDEYKIHENIIEISGAYGERPCMTIRYNHPVQYLIVDIPKETRRSNIMDNGMDENKQIAQSVVARRSHYVMDPVDFNGNALFDNSYGR